MRASSRLVPAAGLWLVVLVIGAVALPGCGAGDSKTPPAAQALASQPLDRNTGALEFRLAFPQLPHKAPSAKPKTRANGIPYNGEIPVGSHAVTIKLTDPASGDLLAPVRTVTSATRPDGVTGTIVVGFPLLRVGPVKVDVLAYPDPGAASNPLATGSTITEITANATAQSSVQMVLTFSKLVVTPRSQTLRRQQQTDPPTGMVDAQALDAQGKPLLYPLEYVSSNPTLVQITSVSDDFMHAMLTQTQFVEGTITIQITVMEPNSGATDTVDVTTGF